MRVKSGFLSNIFSSAEAQTFSFYEDGKTLKEASKTVQYEITRILEYLLGSNSILLNRNSKTGVYE